MDTKYKYIANPEEFPRAESSMQIRASEEQFFDPNILALLEITADGRKVGIAEIAFANQENQISIEQINIFEDERRKGYGRQAYQKIVDDIIENYPQTRKITYVALSMPSLKTNISTPVPEGWHRMFELSKLEQGDFVRYEDTAEEQKARECIESEGIIFISLIKND